MHRIAIAVRRALAWAVREGVIRANPVARLTIPTHTRVVRAVTKEEAEALIRKASPEERDLLEVPWRSGYRPGGALRVTARQLRGQIRG
jgi:site-specific recombinase XerC